MVAVPQEKLLYAKLEELDEIKRGLYSQEVDRVEKLFENRYKQDVEKEPKLTGKDTNKEKIEVEIHAKNDKEQVKHMLNLLDSVYTSFNHREIAAKVTAPRKADVVFE